MNSQKMLKQMQKMQADMERVQSELAQESVTAAAGGGAVTARVSGALELLEDTVVAAVNEGMRQAQQLAQQRLGAVAGGLSGLGIPGL